MTLIRALSSVVPTAYELLKLSSSFNKPLGQAVQDSRFTVVINSLVQFRQTLYLRKDDLWQESRVASTTRDKVLCELVQKEVKLHFLRYISAAKAVGCFWKAPRLVEKINDGATSENSNAIKDFLSARHFDSAVSSSADERSVPPHI